LDRIQIFLYLGGAALLLYLLRSILTQAGGAGERRRALEKLDAEARKDSLEASREHLCPLCSAPCVFHRYPHIEVWRCSRFPACRGFLKARKQKKPAFARKWEEGRGKRLSR
jgi:hypothetical protein